MLRPGQHGSSTTPSANPKEKQQEHPPALQQAVPCPFLGHTAGCERSQSHGQRPRQFCSRARGAPRPRAAQQLGGELRPARRSAPRCRTPAPPRELRTAAAPHASSGQLRAPPASLRLPRRGCPLPRPRASGPPSLPGSGTGARSRVRRAPRQQRGAAGRPRPQTGTPRGRAGAARGSPGGGAAGTRRGGAGRAARGRYVASSASTSLRVSDASLRAAWREGGRARA